MSYQCVIVDPPWPYRDQMLSMTNTGNGAAAKYSVMSLEAIRLFITASVHIHGAEYTDCLDDVIADDCHLWMWITNAHLLDGAHLPVLKFWGFEAKTIATWVKGRLSDPGEFPNIVHHVGQGHYLRNTTEHCIFAVRGRLPANVRNLPTSFLYPARWEGRKHSEKPPVIHEWAERLSPGPRLEIFARRRRENWDAIGDEL